MGRLDDLYQELQGAKAKTQGAGAGSASALGTQPALRDVQPASPSKMDVSVIVHRDLGTKKDPAKLRPRVTPNKIEDPIAPLLESSEDLLKRL